MVIFVIFILSGHLSFTTFFSLFCFECLILYSNVLFFPWNEYWLINSFSTEEIEFMMSANWRCIRLNSISPPTSTHWAVRPFFFTVSLPRVSTEDRRLVKIKFCLNVKAHLNKLV